MRQRGVEFRVGVFVLLAVTLFGVAAFSIGAQRSFFAKKVTYTARFRDVQGLRPGSPVRVAGVVVGSITKVEFTPQSDIEVTFRVNVEHADLIRGNPSRLPAEGDTTVPQPSRASIGSKGMLGDKLLDVSIGDSRLPRWPSSKALAVVGEEGDVFAAAARVMAEAEDTVRNLRLATEPFADQKFSRDVSATAANFAQISDEIAHGNGTMGRLLRDEPLADDVNAAMRSIRATSDELSHAARDVRQIADEVQHGDGSAHRILYGPEAADAVRDIGTGASEIASTLRAVREGDGALHGLIYGEEGHDLLANLEKATDDIAHITSYVRSGRGTLGGLLIDPSIYEDVKRLVGDLERNDVLRALVRYSIRRDRSASEPTVTNGSRDEMP